MAHNKLYRNFIILQEDKKNKSSSSDKALSGYAKIEAKGEKCKITFYAQNLKEDDDYAIVLICYKKDLKQIIDIGPLTVNEVGKGEACLEYYSDNIAGLSLGYDKISGAGICKKNNGYMDFSMYGFMNGVKPEDSWKKMKVISSYDKNDVSKQKDTNKKTKDKKLEYKKLDDEKLQDKKEELKYKENDNLKDKNVEYKTLEYDKEYEEKTSNKKEIYDVEDNNDIKEYCGEEKYKRGDTVENNETTESDNTLDDNNIIDVDNVIEVNDALDNEDLRGEESYNEESDDFDSDLDDEDRHKKKHKHDNEHCKKHDHHKEIHDKCDEHKDFEHHKHEGDFVDHKNNKDYDCDYDVKEYKKKIHEYYCDRDNLAQNFENYERKIEDQRLDPYDFSLRGKVGSFFENLAKGFDEVKEGFKELPYCKWFKVPINDIDDMCNTKDYNKYSIIYYPMLNYYPYIKKYGYFMTGYKCDSKGNLKYLVYAIPGRKDREEQPYCGKSGFVTWCKKEYDDNGFWLMFYDYKNSTIVVPSK